MHGLRPKIQIIMFGSPNVSQASLPFPAACKGLLPTVADLAQMYSDADLGIVFSTTNPSLVPFEMLACGLPVADLDLPGAELNYGGRRDIALLGSPLPAEMAQQVIALLDNPEERQARAEACRSLRCYLPR